MRHFETLADLLTQGDEDAVAVGAPGLQPLPYRQLRSLVARTVERLNALGIGRNDRVAIALKNGPEIATAFVAVAAGATAAPLNPNYRDEQFEFYLTDLRPKALLVEAGVDSPSRAVAKRLSIPIIELQPWRHLGAGEFSLETNGSSFGNGSASGVAGPDDIALVLHTSGTTSRPNIVPLSHRNIISSTRQIQNVLQLSPADRCLNIMPLFHVHGLMAAVSASLAAGASVWCTPGFNALRFFSWMNEVSPTWYTAVPTMHQAILARSRGHREILDRRQLRFIRSASAPLPPQVMEKLEKSFQAPVIEAYGMTEATHQIASNPLPPRARKGGSVGISAGPEIAIMDEQGNLLPILRAGEVVIRGPNVTRGYENNPQANARAFTDGWFRTGDQGVMDEDGYLRLTGRLKEMINRGGEKISPLDVDEVLMKHPAVAQVVTFAVPHQKLGEEVAAAVVLHDGHTLSDRELRDFADRHLAEFKVPRKIIFLREIPKGATGKLQRIGLAMKLGLAEPAA
ncbi:MAG TPA: acyl--CoA ligase [Myxococcaceae bacterium]|nr:acyl--CoA ligase [Myxococcaceae bacterium]